MFQHLKSRKIFFSVFREEKIWTEKLGKCVFNKMKIKIWEKSAILWMNDSSNNITAPSFGFQVKILLRRFIVKFKNTRNLLSSPKYRFSNIFENIVSRKSANFSYSYIVENKIIWFCGYKLSLKCEKIGFYFILSRKALLSIRLSLNVWSSPSSPLPSQVSSEKIIFNVKNVKSTFYSISGFWNLII